MQLLSYGGWWCVDPRIDSFLRGRSRGFLRALAIVLIGGIGLLDFVTGYDLSLSLFYLAPVALLAWYDTPRTSHLASFLSALVWLAANVLVVAPSRLTPSLALWNTAIRLGFFLIVAQLLSSLRTAHEVERDLARTDPLTGAYNGRAFRELLRLELLRSQRMGYPLSLIYLDMDNFKSLNDRRGHAQGDALLQAVGGALGQGLRATDVVGRLGGDEFTILLPDVDREQAGVVAAKLRSILTDAINSIDAGVSARMGVITCQSQPPDVEALISAADSLMYEAKRRGRDLIQQGNFDSAS